MTCRDLELNEITSVDNGDFAGLGNLQYLYVAIIDTRVMSRSGEYSRRNIGDNLITSIENGAFTGLSLLSDLYATILRCSYLY